MKKLRTGKIVNYITHQLIELQNGKLRMGDNFERKVNSITDGEAFATPPSIHGVAGLMTHLTAWSNDTILKIGNGTGQLRDHDEQNCPIIIV